MVEGWKTRTGGSSLDDITDGTENQIREKSWTPKAHLLFRTVYHEERPRSVHHEYGIKRGGTIYFFHIGHNKGIGEIGCSSKLEIAQLFFYLLGINKKIIKVI